MEGRQSRASARYGPFQTAPVFTGPVRRWKKRWVSCSQQLPPPQGKNSNRKKRSSTTDDGNLESCRKDVAPLMLCRWTPLSASDADEPRSRRCRYAPVVPIPKKNTEGVVKVNNNETRTHRKAEDLSESSEATNVRIDGDDLLENSNSEDSSPDEHYGVE